MPWEELVQLVAADARRDGHAPHVDDTLGKPVAARQFVNSRGLRHRGWFAPASGHMTYPAGSIRHTAPLTGTLAVSRPVAQVQDVTYTPPCRSSPPPVSRNSVSNS